MTRSHTLRLYTRPGCHLCDESRRLLERLKREFRFSVEEIDITSDRDAQLRYWSTIPVVVVGESTVPAALDEARLRSVLEWELRDGEPERA